MLLDIKDTQLIVQISDQISSNMTLHMKFEEYIIKLGTQSAIKSFYSNTIFCCKEVAEKIFHQSA